MHYRILLRLHSLNSHRIPHCFLLLFLILSTGAVLATENPDVPPNADPMIQHHPGFASEQSCRDCHRKQAEAFSQSNHARAMALATAETVLGDFSGVHFQQGEVKAHFFTRDGRFWVRTQGPDGKPADFEIRYTFGFEPLQQYLIPLPGGRLQALDIAWDTQHKRWFWLGEGDPAIPGSTFHWTGAFYRWNRTCAVCHSTDVKSGFDSQKQVYHTSYVDTTIGCQSCHGPAAEHVAWARRNPTQTRGANDTPPAMPTIEYPMESCFGCHARRTQLVNDLDVTQPFLDQFSPSMLTADLYHADGQILDEVFEYGSFQQSKMARAGVTCLDCHDPHSGRLLRPGNSTCTLCHSQTPPDRFAQAHPGGQFDSPAHTHHPAGSEGAQCVNCHMPSRVYMKVDPRRDHSFVIPRPDLSEQFGVPNACTQCHAQQSNQWAAQTMDRWYGDGWRQRPNPAAAFSAARNNDASALTPLRRIAGDTSQAGIVRGSALMEMARLSGPSAFDSLQAGSRDLDPLVRLGAAEAAGSLPEAARMAAIGPLLSDESRAVRLAALRALAAVPPTRLSPQQRAARQQAMADLEAYAEANENVAEAQATVGRVLLDMQQTERAEEAFKRAIVLDSTFVGGYISLAELYRSLNDNTQSAAVYARAVKALPERADVHYGYALALVRQQQLGPAIKQLQRARRLAPEDRQYALTLSLALQQSGQMQAAFANLQTIDAGDNVDLLSTRLNLALQLGHYATALADAEALARLQPANPQLPQLIRQLRQHVPGANGK